MQVLVLQGGSSPEREISLQSGEAIGRALRTLNHTVVTYDTREGLAGMIPLLPQTDVVFPMLHGVGGEDGSIQQFLEDYHMLYVGTGIEGSKNCFDKITAKKILEENGLPTPKWAEVNAASFITSPLAQQPYVLKPRSGGSSIDTFIVRVPTAESVEMSVFDRYETLLLEELVTGVELTASILGSESLPLIEIVPPQGKEFDFTNKYNGATQELCPPQNVSQPLQEQVQSLAEQAHQILGARHYSRIDVMMSSNGEFYILEVNTIPGMTTQSLYPKAALATGMSMTDLVQELLDMALHGNTDHY